jgi:hypothetical protein
VLDPFCGCGTAVVVSERLHRPWIGIDITHLAINVIRRRLYKTFGSTVELTVEGEPKDLAGAKELAVGEKTGRYEFQWWVLDKLDGRRRTLEEKKKGPDRGIDGRIFFTDATDATTLKTIIVSVKSGAVSVRDTKDLIATVAQERAEMGVLVTLEEPTGPMRVEATGAGYYHSGAWNKDYPKIQILTVADIFAGKKADYPGHNLTYPEAIRIPDKSGQQEVDL